MKNKPVTASLGAQQGALTAEYHPDTGRLRILDDSRVLTESFPPHSWFAIASAAGKSRWGTLPDENDLRLLLENFLLQRDPHAPRIGGLNERN